MTKSEQLAKQAEELKKLESKLFALLGQLSTPNENQKTNLWNAIVPHIKSSIEKKMRGELWNESELRDIVLTKAVKAVLYEEIWSDLEKV